MPRRHRNLTLAAICVVLALGATACQSRGTAKLDAAEVVTGGIVVSGWAVEDDALQGMKLPLVWVSVDGVPTAATRPGLPRPDVSAAHPRYPANTGFQVLVSHPDPSSVEEVCVLAELTASSVLSNDGACAAPTSAPRSARCDDPPADSVDLSGCDLRGRSFAGATLTRADLRSSNLSGVVLGNANLGAAHLEGADLRGANLTGANLHQAFLEGADLTGADLTGAQFVQDALFSNTTCPDGRNSDVVPRCGY